MTQDADTGTEVELIHPRDVLILEGLVTGLSLQATAEHAGVSRSTVDRRIADPQFRLALTEAMADKRDQLLAASVSSAITASRYLLNVVTGAVDASTTERIRAAGILLRVTGYAERD